MLEGRPGPHPGRLSLPIEQERKRPPPTQEGDERLHVETLAHEDALANCMMPLSPRTSQAGLVATADTRP
jgi:hypothetical protein